MSVVRAVAAVAVTAAALAAGCGQRALPTYEPLTRGNPSEGARAVHALGCPACHRIPGVARASGLVGPPLDGLRQRVYLGGVLPNTADNLVAWIQDPPRFSPKTAMPNVGATEAQARDIAAFLYSR
jgi:cytochrome c1